MFMMMGENHVEACLLIAKNDYEVYLTSSPTASIECGVMRLAQPSNMKQCGFLTKNTFLKMKMI